MAFRRRSSPLALRGEGVAPVEAGFSVHADASIATGLFKRLPKSGDRLRQSYSWWHRRTLGRGENFEQFLGWGNPNGATDYWWPRYKTGGGVNIQRVQSSGAQQNYFDNGDDLARDPSGWFHDFVIWDSGNATASLRARWFRNNVELPNPSGITIPQNTNTLGWLEGGIPDRQQGVLATRWNTGILASDGPFHKVEMWEGPNAPLTPDAVGELDGNGIWVPKVYEGPDSDYGLRGFRMLFDDPNHMGKDDREGDGWGATYEAAQWDGATVDFNFTDGKISGAVSSRAVRRLIEQFDGDFEISWTYEAGFSPRLGVYEVDEDSTFNPNDENGGMAAMTDSWWVTQTTTGGGANVLYGGATVATWTAAAADVLSLRRVGGTLSFRQNDGLIHQWTQTSTNPVRIVVSTQATGTIEIHQLEWQNGATLLGNSFFNLEIASAGANLFNLGPQSLDTPLNPYPNLNSLHNISTNGRNIIEGGLRMQSSAAASISTGADIRLPPSGKWQCRVECIDPAGMRCGIGSYDGNTAYDEIYVMRSDGQKYSFAGGAEAYGSAYGAGAFIDILVDCDAGTIAFINDGTPEGIAYSGIDFTDFWYFFLWVEGAGNAGDMRVDFGQLQSFAFESGYRPLSRANMQTPDIIDGREYFAADARSGTGAAASIIRPFGPNYSWLKRRDGVDSHRNLDTDRGATIALRSNLADAEITELAGLTAFNADGYDLGNQAAYNGGGNTFIDWNWRVHVNAGFAILIYTGNGTPRALPHGLGRKPFYVPVKRRDLPENWIIYHQFMNQATPEQFFAVWNDLGGAIQNLTIWDNKQPDETNIYLGDSNAVNADGGLYVALVYAPIPGFSAFGSYKGNGITDGPDNDCGLLPAHLHLKNIETSTSSAWPIHDSARDPWNPARHELVINDAAADRIDAARGVDLTCKGFKIRNTAGNFNANGQRYIYAAWAQNPQLYARAR